jgi:hypothetical protein
MLFLKEYKYSYKGATALRCKGELANDLREIKVFSSLSCALCVVHHIQLNMSR